MQPDFRRPGSFIPPFMQVGNLTIQRTRPSGGLRRCGSSVVNALSVYMDVEISRDGYVHHDRFERGKPVVELEDGLLPKIAKTRKTGTKVNFLPDDTIFEKTRFRAEESRAGCMRRHT